MKKLIYGGLMLLLYIVFVFIFIGVKGMTKADDAVAVDVVVPGGYRINFEDSVYGNRFFRHVFIYKNDELVSVKDCSVIEILMPVELEVCKTGRRSIW